MKAIILLTRRDGDTPEDFRRWWLEEHAPLARQLPGLRKLVFNLVEGDALHDGVAELWFDSVEEFESAYAGEIGRRVAADSISRLAERVRLVVVEHPQLG